MFAYFLCYFHMRFTLMMKTERNLKCFLLQCNLFVLIWFLPPVFLVMIYEALYIKVLKYSAGLSESLFSPPTITTPSQTWESSNSESCCCLHYFTASTQGGSIAAAVHAGRRKGGRSCSVPRARLFCDGLITSDWLTSHITHIAVRYLVS